MPIRIQRSRKKGWRKPVGAVIVDRTSRWGNPFKVGNIGVPDAITAVKLFEKLFEKHLALQGTISELKGKDLVCFCPLDQPCHADVLLRLANPKQEVE